MYCSGCFCGRFLPMPCAGCSTLSANILLDKAGLKGANRPSLICLDCCYSSCVLQSFVISVTPWMFCLLRWDASFSYMSFDPVDAAVVALRAERQDVGGPWLCVPGAGMGRCREVRRDVGGPWLCVPGAGMGCCREAGREWWYAGQSGPLSRYDPQYHAQATKRWQCRGREWGPIWTNRAPCRGSERYHGHAPAHAPRSCTEDGYCLA